MPRILDGAAIAAAIKQEVAEEVKLLAAQGVRPGLAAVLVGHVPASEIYVRSKVQACAELGIFSDLITPPDTITTEEMLYLEPSTIAYANKRDVDENYVRLAELALSSEGYTGIATHDPGIIDRVARFAAAKGLPKRGRFEFQMLYGIGTPLAQKLIAQGYRVRLAIPFGSHWFPYLMRRLAERPANLMFFLKGALSRG
jgi:proline dehydrogenase